MPDMTRIEKLKAEGLVSESMSPETEVFINDNMTDAEVDALISLNQKLGEQAKAELIEGGCV